VSSVGRSVGRRARSKGRNQFKFAKRSSTSRHAAAAAAAAVREGRQAAKVDLVPEKRFGKDF
jgi:hypothetical protein